jgi:hypothetical protein
LPIGRWGILEDAITIIKRAIGHPNKNVNLAKTCIPWPRREPLPHELIDECNEQGVQLKLQTTEILGGVIGCCDDAVTQHVDSVVKSYKPLLEAVSHPRMTKQIEAMILRMCANTRINYQLRIHPPQLTHDAAQDFDRDIQDTFASIPGLTKTDVRDDECS